MKEYLKKIIAARTAQVTELRKSIKESQDANEVRALGETLEKVLAELQEAKDKLAEVDGEGEGAGDEAANEEGRKFNPLASYDIGKRDNEPKLEGRASKEYEKQFMEYVRTGFVGDKLEKRADATGTSADLGILIPETIEQEIQQALKGHYGTLYAKVKKTNIKGGVKVPLGAFSATFNRIAESGKSDRQDAGGVTGNVTFGYNIGEIRLARTLLQDVLSVDAFNVEFAKVIAETYVKAMDTEIISGVAASNQCEGILTEAAKASNGRITSARIISFTAAEIADWTEWEKKFFAILPVELEVGGEFVMAKKTYVSNLCTMTDSNGQPINKAGYNLTDKQYEFNAVPVNRVNETLFKAFDTASANEYFGMYWIPEKAYAINSNLEFYVTRYFDQETNQYVDKALVINDGKILDPAYIYLLKKSA